MSDSGFGILQGNTKSRSIGRKVTSGYVSHAYLLLPHYGELREVAIGFINDRLFVCVYTDQEETRRVISLRKANQREMRRYGENLEQGGA